MTTIREIDHDGERVETGPTRIGKDWCGLFIRGDHCFGTAMYLRRLLSWIETRERPTNREEAFFFDLHVGALTNLIEQMESTNEALHEDSRP